MRSALVFFLLALLTGCASTPPPPPPPSTTTVSAPVEEEVRARLEAALRAQGLMPEATPSGFAATSRAARATWANCRRQLIQSHGDPAQRASWEAPGARAAELTVGLRPSDSGVQVTVVARLTATYHNPFRNLPVEGATRPVS